MSIRGREKLIKGNKNSPKNTKKGSPAKTIGEPFDFMVLQRGFEPPAPGLGILYNTFKIIQLQTIVAILGANSTEKHLTIN